MKRLILTLIVMNSFLANAQEHFAGLTTSNRVGILNGTINPAEYVNLTKKFEVNIYGISFNVSNNKIAFSDFSSDTNFEELLFSGSSPVNARVDAEILGPGFAVRWKKWGFGFTTKAIAKFDMVEVDPTVGEAITNNNLINTTLLEVPGNQRLNGVSYGEIGFSLARNLIDKNNHKFNAGVTLKLLFPGTYSNFGLSNLNGTITQFGGSAFLHTNGPATLNVAYSGNLGESFTNFEDYSQSIFGGLRGFSGDLGLNYQWLKDGKYLLNAGFSIRNIGSMTFKDDNNYSTNYILNIPQSDPLNLAQFEDIDNLSEVENILISNGYLNKTSPEKKDFKVKLPTTLNLYADVKIAPKVYVSGFLQQRTNDNQSDDQVTASNVFNLSPRVNLGFFESYLPITFHEISGTNVGLGFRLGGFYLGTSSLVTALINDSNQGDIYTGFRWAF